MLRNGAAILFVSIFLCASESLSSPYLTNTFIKSAMKVRSKKALTNILPVDLRSVLLKSAVSPDLIYISPALIPHPVLEQMIAQRANAEEQFKNFLMSSAVTNTVSEQVVEMLITFKVWECTIKGIEEIIKEHRLLSGTDVVLSELMDSRLGAVSLFKPLELQFSRWLRKYVEWEAENILIGEYGVPYQMKVIGDEIKSSVREWFMQEVTVAISNRQVDPELMMDEVVRYLWAQYQREITNCAGIHKLRERLERIIKEKMHEREAGTLMHHISFIVRQMQKEISEQPFSEDSLPLKVQLDMVWKPALKLNFGRLQDRNFE